MDKELESLVKAAQGGDTMAMDALLGQLIPYAARICGPIAGASTQDAIQETMIAVLRGLRSLKDRRALFGWLRAIAVREALRISRRDNLDTPMDLADVQAADGAELGVDIHAVLAKLSPEHRAILVLRDIEGLDEREAAEILGIAKGTVKSRLHRARSRFRGAWGR
jgi:RNA polymerase sigma-70 factor (ECF subfamily)